MEKDGPLPLSDLLRARDLLQARDGQLLDLGQQLKFPSHITVTTLCSDIVLVSETSKQSMAVGRSPGRSFWEAGWMENNVLSSRGGVQRFLFLDQSLQQPRHRCWRRRAIHCATKEQRGPQGGCGTRTMEAWQLVCHLVTSWSVISPSRFQEHHWRCDQRHQQMYFISYPSKSKISLLRIDM